MLSSELIYVEHAHETCTDFHFNAANCKFNHKPFQYVSVCVYMYACYVA